MNDSTLSFPLAGDQRFAGTSGAPIMVPVSFGGCFGWLHTNGDAVSGEFAVLLCPALHRDAQNSHQGLRILADRLAKLGYPTLRFDYPETGDSCDRADMPAAGNDLWATWQHSVDMAADFLRTVTGANRLILGGLRIGATLAILAAERRSDVTGLILLAPVLRGQSYLLQLWVEAKLQQGTAPPMRHGISVNGMNFDPLAVQSLRAVDVQRVSLAGRKLLLLAQAPTERLAACCKAWTAQGANIVSTGFDGCEPLLQNNLEDDKGTPDFTQLIAWVLNACPQPAADQRVGRVADVPYAPLRPRGCIESPMFYGPAQNLFGMLCRPDGPAKSQVVLIGNTGRDPRHGVARFGVEFSRRLAREGIASLRVDFAGLGDSIGPIGDEDALSAVMDLDRSPDITAAIDALQDLNFEQVAGFGLCAGAYHMLLAALQDVRIKHLMLVNMPIFTWRRGDRIDYVRNKARPLRAFAGGSLGSKSSLALLAKRHKIIGFLRGQMERVLENMFKRIRRLGWLLGICEASPGSPGSQMMTLLAARGARTFFLFAPEDNGLFAVEQEFGSKSALAAFNGVTLELAPMLDHDLSTEPIQRIAADLMLDFLAGADTVSGFKTV